MIDMPREELVRVLSAVPESRLIEVTDRFTSAWKVQAKSLPQSGLGMLKMRDSALGDTFYLGEFPLSSCSVVVITEHGAKAEGAALVMDDRIDYAERLALCDAVLFGGLPGWQSVANLIDEGLEKLEDIAQERKIILDKTRVNFTLLDEAGGDDA
jgi:alpha-D-ribose 1-methylphosphonate 5-triphosphate synthase subunit PhnG